MSYRIFLKRMRLYICPAVLLILLKAIPVSGYVMPPEQALDFMCDNFRKVQTVSIVQSTLQRSGINERVFTEQIWLESPDRFFVKALDRMGNRDVISPDLMYRQLFVMNSSERIERLLLSTGIDVSRSSLTRVEGVTSIMIGAGGHDRPRLILEKERFLPLLISYRIPDDDELVTVTFRDYQKTVIGWHPFEIIYKKGESLIEKYTVQGIEENVPVNTLTMSRNPEYRLPQKAEPEDIAPEPFPYTSEADAEHLREVLKTYEEQYQ
ncbi:MAG: hypothetical protein GX846_07925 [Deltaproteobacteria bacterium]|nr:hypothetical protein [Deltaproteobacteria bacterium]